jgi:drug/metabolite transporter (DMT)-like permease
MPAAARLVPALFVVLWATGFIGARYAMPYAEPFTFLAARFGLTIAILGAIVAWRRRAGLSPRAAFHAAIAGSLMHGVYLGGVFWAVRNGMPAGLSALVIGLQPLITALLAGAVLGETVLPRHWIGLATGFAGVAIVLAPKFSAAAGDVTGANLAACLVAVIGMSVGTIWQKRFVASGDIVTATLWQYLGGAVPTVALALALERQEVTLNAELVFALAWLVLVLSIGAIFLLMYLIRVGVMARVASLFYLVPAVTAVMAWALFGESLTGLQLFGMAVTTAGVALATRAPAQSATRARASE